MDVPDFTAYRAGSERKQAFFSFLHPLVKEANAGIREEREKLLSLAAKGEPGWWDTRWLHALARDYKLEPDKMPLDELMATLTRRVDVIPAGLALAQAAKESGWGTSRFFREGHNLFGHWCFVEGCGLVPLKRSSSSRHEVAVFDSPLHSVERYMNNLNTHRSYRPLRLIRSRLRSENQEVPALALAEGLESYSERGAPYVEEIKALIAYNNLENLR